MIPLTTGLQPDSRSPSNEEGAAEAAPSCVVYIEPSRRALSSVCGVADARAPHVDGGEEEQPHDIDEVPVPSGELEAEVLLGGELTGIGPPDAAIERGVGRRRSLQTPTPGLYCRTGVGRMQCTDTKRYASAMCPGRPTAPGRSTPASGPYRAFARAWCQIDSRERNERDVRWERGEGQ